MITNSEPQAHDGLGGGDPVFPTGDTNADEDPANGGDGDDQPEVEGDVAPSDGGDGASGDVGDSHLFGDPPNGDANLPDGGDPAGDPATGDGPGDPDTPEQSQWRPMPWRLDAELGAAADFPQIFNAAQGDSGGNAALGRYGGATLQWNHGMHRSVADPDVIVWSQDMGHPRISEDGGRSWRTMDNLGLEQPGGGAITIDPSDSNVILGVFTAAAKGNLGGAESNALKALQGIYRSTNRGHSWSAAKIGLFPAYYFDLRANFDLFAPWPLVGGSADTRVWKLILPIQQNPSTSEGWQCFQGNEGGVTASDWAQKGGLYGSVTHGVPRVLIQHPSDFDTLWLATSKGVFRTTDWSAAAPTWTPLHAEVNDDDGDFGGLWVDADDPDVIMVSSTTKGLGISTDGGLSWTWEATVQSAWHVTASAKDSFGVRTIYQHASKRAWAGGEDQVYYATWDTVARSLLTGLQTIDPAATPDVAAHYQWRDTTGSVFSVTLPHPSDPDDVLINGHHHFWKTTSGPTGFADSNAGGLGTNIRDFVFDANDPNRIDCPAADTQWITSSNRGLSFNKTNGSGSAAVTAPTTFTAHRKSGTAVVRLSTAASHPGRVLLAYGDGIEHAIVYHDVNDSFWSDPVTPPPWHRTTRMDYDRQNPDTVYAGQYRSMDAGDTWTKLTEVNGYDVSFVAMSLQDGRTIYGYSRDTAANPDAFEIYRSTDRGASWQATPVVSTWRNTLDGEGTSHHYQFWLDPTRDDRFYTVNNASNDLYMVSGSEPPQALGLMARFRGAATYFIIKQVVVDPLEPRNIYVMFAAWGQTTVVWGRWDADLSSIVWTDLTQNFPRAVFNSGLAVSPHTSEVFAGTQNGMFVHPPADGRTYAHSVYPRLAKPIRERDTYSPHNTHAPTITGDNTTAGQLTCATGAWAAKPSPTYSYRWERNGTTIVGENDSSYTKRATDAGMNITCTVTANNAQGAASESSETLHIEP